MAGRRIKPLCKRTVIHIRQVQVKHLELKLRYMEIFFNNGSMEIFFNNGSMAMKFHILNVHEGLGQHAKDERCA